MSKRKIKLGDKIDIYYRGLLDDDSEFESNFDKEPYEMVVGETKLIKGFEKTLIGMSEKEKVRRTYTPDEAYGYHNPALIAVLDKSEFPKNSIPAVGWMMKIGEISVTIIAIDEKTVTLDGNHPLVGKDVDFEIEVIKILSK